MTDGEHIYRQLCGELNVRGLLYPGAFDNTTIGCVVRFFCEQLHGLELENADLRERVAKLEKTIELRRILR